MWRNTFSSREISAVYLSAFWLQVLTFTKKNRQRFRYRLMKSNFKV